MMIDRDLSGQRPHIIHEASDEVRKLIHFSSLEQDGLSAHFFRRDFDFEFVLFLAQRCGLNPKFLVSSSVSFRNGCRIDCMHGYLPHSGSPVSDQFDRLDACNSYGLCYDRSSCHPSYPLPPGLSYRP